MAIIETGATDLPLKAIDPVCGMDVEPGKTKLVSIFKDRRYWFCAEGCRRAFEANPDKYLKKEPARKKGRVARFLQWMAKSNEKEFGCAGPKCH